jgi:hypothetical protein
MLPTNSERKLNRLCKVLSNYTSKISTGLCVCMYVCMYVQLMQSTDNTGQCIEKCTLTDEMRWDEWQKSIGKMHACKNRLPNECMQNALGRTSSSSSSWWWWWWWCWGKEGIVRTRTLTWLILWLDILSSRGWWMMMSKVL